MKKLLSIVLIVSAAIMISLTGCNKEGPAGANGKDGLNGTNGTNGLDANETCKLCHAAAVVDKISTEFELSKHQTGVVAEEEAGNVFRRNGTRARKRMGGSGHTRNHSRVF